MSKILENTLENKAKFFALYYGQEVLKASSVQGIHKVGKSFMGKIYPDQYLEIKPLPSVSDDDKEHLDALQASSFDEYGYWFGMGGVHYYQPHEVDYLRSCGYALPWMGLSVEKLIEYGWVKLKED